MSPPSWYAGSLVILLVSLHKASSKSGKDYDFSRIPKTTKIQVYYESLCPYSIAFITEQLWPTYLRLGYLMDVQLIPFGNAFEEEVQDEKEHRRGIFTPRRVKYNCQHGPEECFGNAVQACASKIFNDSVMYLAFVTCMSSAGEPHKAGAECANAIANNWDEIEKCATTQKGLQLQGEMGRRTWNLDPPHGYVPWIVVNGVHSDETQSLAQTDLLQLVCDSISGKKPAPCLQDRDTREVINRLSGSIERPKDPLGVGSE